MQLAPVQLHCLLLLQLLLLLKVLRLWVLQVLLPQEGWGQ
jgi:hypothetical protein